MAARAARLALADARALEEEAERVNPIDGRGLSGGMVGAGATPSMGLSMFRGGGMEEYSSSDEEMVGAGTLHITHEGAGMDEAYGMGKHLSEHLHKLHGAGFWDSFKSGFDSVMKVAAPIAKVALPMVSPGLGTAASLGLTALGYGTHKGDERKTARKAYEGAGKEPPVPPFDIAEHSGKYEGKGFTGQGKGDKKRRGELVRYLMKTHGMKLGEASKFIKANNLY